MKKIGIVLVLIFCAVFSYGQDYKVMTYNIRYDNPNDGENQWKLRKDFLANQIRFFAPDVFGIQEGLHHQVTYLNQELTNYNFVGVGRDDGKQKGEYSAIFYNKAKFKLLQSNTFWLSETPNKISVGWDASMERICTYALFKDKNTHQQFWVFNTHFDHIGEKARQESAKLIYAKTEALNAKNFPVIVMGDFNLEPNSKPIQYLSSKINDTYHESVTKPFGPKGTFNNFKFYEPVTKRIDYIFTSKKIKIHKYAVLSDAKDCKYPSDHLPVFVVFNFDN